MARADFKHGRFTPTWETREIYKALRGWQSTTGDEIDYYRFSATLSTASDIYDEGAGAGRVFVGPMRVPVLHVVHGEGGNQDTPQGFYTNDTLKVTASLAQLSRAGLDKIALQTGLYLRDRIVYDDKLWRVMELQVLGQVQRMDVIAAISATQLKADEVVNDWQFARWASDAMAVDTQTNLPAGAYGEGTYGADFYGA